MVKLGRILKSEYRDDDGMKRSRRSSKKKTTRREILDLRGDREILAQDAPGAPALRGDLQLPSGLMDILQSQVQAQLQDFTSAELEEREPIEPSPTSPSTTSDNPHLFALTRAAQMALRSLPSPDDGGEQTNKDNGSNSNDNKDSRTRDEQSTMELIDTIVKTSNDPALVDALQAMMGESQSQSHQQRETLALVAESLMEKKAAKVALERAAMAESRLQESLKKCAPELVGDAAAFAAADVPTGVENCVSVDAAMLHKQDSVISTPNTNTNNNNTARNSGFFHRINKSLTSTSQAEHSKSRISFVNKKSRNGKSSKSKKKSSSKGMSKADKAAIKAAEKMAKEAMLIAAKAAEPDQEEDQYTKKPDLPNPVKDMTAVEGEIAANNGKEENQEDEIEVEGRDDQEHINTDRETTSDSAGKEQHVVVPRRTNKYKHIASTEPQIMLPQYSDSEEAGSACSTSLEDGDYADENGSETNTESGAGEPTELVIDTPKIEYTIFELESKLSQSTCSSSSSVLSDSSRGSYQSEDDNAVDHVDTADEASLTDGNETGASNDDDSESDDDDDNLLFASFCQRPGSFDHDDDDDDSREVRRGRNGRKHRDEAIEDEMPSLLKCVSGYFVGGSDRDVEVRLDEKKRRKRRSRSRGHRRS